MEKQINLSDVLYCMTYLSRNFYYSVQDANKKPIPILSLMANVMDEDIDNSYNNFSVDEKIIVRDKELQSYNVNYTHFNPAEIGYEIIFTLKFGVNTKNNKIECIYIGFETETNDCELILDKVIGFNLWEVNFDVNLDFSTGCISVGYLEKSL